MLGAALPFWIFLAVQGRSLPGILHPGEAWSLIRTLGPEGRAIAAFSAVLGGLVAYWSRMGRLGAAHEVALLPALLETFALYALILSARFMGIVIAARADAFGLPLRVDLLVPALPGVAPRGVRKPRPPIAEPTRPRFLEL